MISKFQIGLKSLLRQGRSEPEFYGDLVYKLKKIVGSNNFSAQFIKIIPIIKILANVLQRVHAWWSTQSWLATLLSSLIARRWVGLQTLWRFRLKDLSNDEMVGAWCFGCCQAQTQTKHICVLIHIWTKGEVGVPLNQFKPSSQVKYFCWPF